MISTHLNSWMSGGTYIGTGVVFDLLDSGVTTHFIGKDSDAGTSDFQPFGRLDQPEEEPTDEDYLVSKQGWRISKSGEPPSTQLLAALNKDREISVLTHVFTHSHGNGAEFVHKNYMQEGKIRDEVQKINQEEGISSADKVKYFTFPGSSATSGTCHAPDPPITDKLRETVITATPQNIRGIVTIFDEPIDGNQLGSVARDVQRTVALHNAVIAKFFPGSTPDTLPVFCKSDGPSVQWHQVDAQKLYELAGEVGKCQEAKEEATAGVSFFAQCGSFWGLEEDRIAFSNG